MEKNLLLIKELPIFFAGRGEVRGHYFRMFKKTKKGYIFAAYHKDYHNPHYEVFLRKVNRRFNVISYPSARVFGTWAWTYTVLLDAIKKLEAISLL